MFKRHPRWVLIISVAVGLLVVVIFALALSGPAIGNVFNTTVASLNRESRAGDNAGANEPVPGAVGDITLASSGEQQRLAEIPVQQGQQRVILMNASLNLTVDNPEARLSEITAMVSEMGGWVVNSATSHFTQSNGEDAASASLTVRVPAARLDEAMTRIKAGAIKVVSENVTGEDVTQQYVDMSSRLKNLQVAEQQLQKIMDSAVKVEDVLAVYDQLVATRGEIESIKGQLQYYDQASAYSLIQIQLMPKVPGVVQTQTAGWNPANAAESAFGALVRLVQIAIDATLATLIFAGPIVVALALAWTLVRYGRKLASRRRA